MRLVTLSIADRATELSSAARMRLRVLRPTTRRKRALMPTRRKSARRRASRSERAPLGRPPRPPVRRRVSRKKRAPTLVLKQPQPPLRRLRMPGAKVQKPESKDPLRSRRCARSSISATASMILCWWKIFLSSIDRERAKMAGKT